MQGLRPDINSLLETPLVKEIESLSPDDLCTICLCRLDGKQDDEMEGVVPSGSCPNLKRIKGCNHVFCSPCIQKWLSRSNFCPVCKYVIIDELSSANNNNNIRTLTLTIPDDRDQQPYNRNGDYIIRENDYDADNDDDDEY